MDDNTGADLLLYRHLGSQIRATVIDGKPWFLVVDLCKVLGYANSRDALRHVEPEDSTKIDIRDVFPGRDAVDSRGRYRGLNRDAWLVTEDGAYDIVFGANVPGARAFRRWLSHEVVPDIARHGQYATEAASTEVVSALVASQETINVLVEVATRLVLDAQERGDYDPSTPLAELEALAARAGVDGGHLLSKVIERYPRADGSKVELPESVLRARMKLGKRSNGLPWALPGRDIEPIADADVWAKDGDQ